MYDKIDAAVQRALDSAPPHLQDDAQVIRTIPSDTVDLDADNQRSEAVNNLLTAGVDGCRVTALYLRPILLTA